MALDKSIQHSRYDMPRSALQLLAKHACQWDQCIIDDYQVTVDIDPCTKVDQCVIADYQVTVDIDPSLGVDGYPTRLSGSGRISTIR